MLRNTRRRTYNRSLSSTECERACNAGSASVSKKGCAACVGHACTCPGDDVCCCFVKKDQEKG